MISQKKRTYKFKIKDMMDFIKVALRDGNGNEAVLQQEYVKQAQRFHGARAFQFVNDYFLERNKKQTFIDEQIFA